MRKLKVRTLWQVSFALCMLFLGAIGINSVLAQSHTDYYNKNPDAVSHAEHEQLKAELEKNGAEIDAHYAVLQQRLTDDEKLIVRNTGIVDEHSSTINRMEGIGISFGLALTVVQYMLFRAHQETRKNKEEN